MKVDFDGATKIITVHTGITELNVKVDLYSDWKEWTLIGDNSKYLSAMRSVGGDPISEVKQLGSTYFLINGWRIRPAEWNHRLSVVGNLYTEEGDSPYLATLGAYSVMIISEVSTLVETVIQNAADIAADVWNYDISGKTAGEIISDIDVDSIADEVWNYTITGRTTGNYISNISNNVWNYNISGKTAGDYLTTSSSGITASDVWNYDISGKTAGEIISDIDVDNIANNVWNYDISGITGNTSGGILNTSDDRLKHILGLVQQNFRFTNQTYNSKGNLTTGTIKIYNTSSDCALDLNPISTYAIYAIYDANDLLIDYKVMLQ